jgi:hypothetical protein
MGYHKSSLRQGVVETCSKSFRHAVISHEYELSCRDDALQTRTNEVTDALRRTTQTMQTELERSVLSVQMLGQSKSPFLTI